MRFSLTGPIRALLLFGIALSATAVGLGRLAPRPSTSRYMLKTSCVGINGYHFTRGNYDGLFLNPETGGFAKLDLPSGDSLDYAVSSPWEDDEGTRQVIGRWVSRTSPEGLTQGFGLARYAFPSGEVLNRVPLEVMPMGVPCFFPGQTARVLFAAGDGHLYRLAFEDEHGLPCSNDDNEVHPTRLVWRTDLAGSAPISIGDPMWPKDPRMAGRLLASITRLVAQEGARPLRHTELWWLEINREATEIVAAGPLHDWNLKSDAANWPEESLPSLRETPEGDLVLAYLLKRDRELGWELRLASLEIDAKTGNPVMDADQSVKLAEARLHTLPVFSVDGRWVYSLPHSRSTPERPDRSPVPIRLHSPLVPRRHLAGRIVREDWN